ncbi:Multidrug resistance protein ABC superfamily [Phytophthora cinnamomi]|uniref:Multidrug resistance protein ABC superfamily n=1 Tax=Phytophthora cinnamomi TaxID=4785 RepID=UPI003559B429|nr:Multidrug resistance protein ABC superfamily [Phytophthora cinnamomi]
MPPQRHAIDGDGEPGAFHELRSPREASTHESTEDKASPLDSANVLSVATIWWLQPLLARGYRAPLTEDSVWDLPKKDQSRRLQGRFDDSWTRQDLKLKTKSKKHKRPSVNVALWAATKDKIAVAMGLYMLSATLTLVQPFLIKAILENLEGEDNMFGISSGYGLAVFLGCVAFCGATAINSAQFLTARAGCNARMVVINSVFQKILRLSATARRAMNSGEVVTLAGVDSERVMEAYTIGLWCIISPIILVAVCILIGTQMGVYVGLVVAATSVAIMYGAFMTSKHIGIYRRRISKISANRVKLTNEVLLGIRVIKFYAWEDSINETIRQIRDEEVALMRRYNYLRLTNAVLMFLAPTILNMVCFLVYILLDNTLDVATAFVILALTNSCKMAFSIFANASVAVSEAITSTGRLSDFLVSGEVEESPHELNLEHDKAVVSFQDADFQWIEDTPAPTLSNITFTLKAGTLTVVVGPIVGDGTLEQLKGEFSFLATSPRGKTVAVLEETDQGEAKQQGKQQRSIEATLSKDEGGDAKKSKAPKKLIVEEDRRVGSVRMKTYVNYLAASEWNGYVLTATIFILFTVAQVSLFFCDWFLSQWSKGAVDLSQKNAMTVYVGIVVASLILTFIRLWMMLYIFQMSSAFIVCAAADPYVLILYIPVGYAFMFAIRIYQSSARELKRLDSTSRSPFLNLVSETISGIETVRSYKMVEQFSSHCEQLLNNNAKFFLLFQSSSRWFAMRTDWLVSVIIAAVAILAIATKSTLGAAVAGLGLTYASQLTSSFQRMTTLTTQVENIMTCFERIAHYGSLDEEGYQRVASNKDSLAADWPRTGAVGFENVSMRPHPG